MITACLVFLGVVGGPYTGFLLGLYYAAQKLGPAETPDGQPANRWQRCAYLIDRIFDVRE